MIAWWTARPEASASARRSGPIQPRESKRSSAIDCQLAICCPPCWRLSAQAVAISCVIAVSGI